MDKSLRVQILLGAVDRVTGPLKTVLKGTRGLSAGLKETQDRLRGLQAAQRDVGRFRELKTGLASTSAELEQARAKAAALAQQMNATANPTRRLTAEFRRSRDAVNALEQRHEAQARELQQVRARMNEAGAASRGLAAHERDLRDAVARTNAELQERRDRLATVSAQQRRMANARAGFDRSQELAGNFAGAGAGAAGAGAALLAPLALANRAAGDYESTLTDVAQKANLTRPAAAALGQELTRVALATNQLPPEVVAATDALTGLGAELGEARDMIPHIARGATAYRASMEDMGRATYAVVDNLDVAATRTGKVLDVMAEAGKRGAFEVRDMAQYFPALTAAAAGLNHTGVPAVADLAAALQITRKGAGDSAEAATNLGNLLQKISAPLTVRNFRKFGIDLEAELRAAAARGESPIEAITNLTNRALGGDLSKLGYLFEDAQVQKALRPLIQNMGEYRSIRAAALAAEGVVNRDFAERMRDQNEATKAASVSVRALGLTIGAQLAPTVTAVASVIGGAASRVTAWAQANPALAGTLAKIVGVVGILLVAVGGIALAIAAILGPLALANLAFTSALPILAMLGGALGVVGKAALFMGRALLMNPIGLAITAIAIAAFLVIRYWTPISGFFRGVWSAVTAAGARALAWFRSVGPQILQFALGMVGPVGLIIRHWSTISAFFAGLWARVRAATSAAVAWFGGLAARFREFGAQMIAGLIQGLLGRLGQLRSTITGVAGRAADWFRSRLGIRSPSRVFAGFGGDTMAGLQIGLQRGQGGPLAAIRSIAGRMAAEGSRGVQEASRAQLGQVRNMATAMGAAFAVGAAGPAMAGGMAGPPSPGRAAASPAASPSYEIHVHAAPGMDPAAIARAVAAELDRRERQAGARSRSTFGDLSET